MAAKNMTCRIGGRIARAGPMDFPIEPRRARPVSARPGRSTRVIRPIEVARRDEFRIAAPIPLSGISMPGETPG